MIVVVSSRSRIGVYGRRDGRSGDKYMDLEYMDLYTSIVLKDGGN